MSYLSRLLTLTSWDLLIQARNQIVTAAAIASLIYIGAFYLLGGRAPEKLLVFLIFSDPAMLGFSFIAVLVLWERGSGVLEALAATPVSVGEYLSGKAISLTIISLAASIALAVAGYGWKFDLILLLTNIALTSVLVVWLGFALSAPTRDFNQFVRNAVFFFLPMSLPLLNFFGLTDTYWFYLLPTQATLLLLEAAFGRSLPGGIYVYAFACLLIWLFLASQLARYVFHRYVRP